MEDWCAGFLDSLAQLTRRGRRRGGSQPGTAQVAQLLDVLAVAGGVRNACLLDRVFVPSAEWSQMLAQLGSAGWAAELEVVDVLQCAVLLHKHRVWQQLEADAADRFARFLFVDVAASNPTPCAIPAGPRRDLIVERIIQGCDRLRCDGTLEGLDPEIAPSLMGVLLGYPVVYVPELQPGSPCGNCLGSQELELYHFVCTLSSHAASLPGILTHGSKGHAIFGFTAPAGMEGVTEYIDREADRVINLVRDSTIWERVDLTSDRIVHPSITL